MAQNPTNQLPTHTTEVVGVEAAGTTTIPQLNMAVHAPDNLPAGAIPDNLNFNVVNRRVGVKLESLNVTDFANIVVGGPLPVPTAVGSSQQQQTTAQSGNVYGGQAQKRPRVQDEDDYAQVVPYQED